MNRSLQVRGTIVVAVLLLSLYWLYPTFQAAMISHEDRARASDPEAIASGDPEVLALKERIDEIDHKAIRRGLDLEGGMYIVLEVDQAGMSADEARDALDRVREIINNRIDQFGVSEPIIQTQGTSRIVVQLPGIQDPDRVRQIIGKTAQLTFHLVRTVDEYDDVLGRLDQAFLTGTTVEQLQAEAEAAADREESEDLAAAEPDSAAAADDTSLAALDELPPLPTPTGEDVLDADDPYVKEHPFSAYVFVEPQMGRAYGTPLFVDAQNLEHVENLLAAPEARVVPRDMEFQLDTEPVSLQGGMRVYPLYLLNKMPSLKGDRLTSARSAPDPDRPGNWQVEMNLDRRGARQFSKVTGENVGRHLAISLDGRVASAPVIQGKIPSGKASITGTFTSEQASDLALLLRAGALPTTVRFEEERTVGPSLGQDSIRQGVRATLYGGIFVVIFILIYYGRTGAIAVVALLSNILILLAVLGQFGLVLTLPGIAGVILTVGMAVDANVLINERIREELRKDKTVKAAVDAGYANATRTIVDANITTLITGVILLWFGTGPIKGFAVTLSIGILTSMFTALVQSRVIMEFMVRNQGQRTVRV
jgi:SecD/SecF fusion protein